MQTQRAPQNLALSVCLLVPLAGCTITRAEAKNDPARIRFEGLIEGFIAFGWPESDQLIQLQVLEGRSSGSLLYFELWRLARLELGLLGASVGVGPLDLAVGTLAYEPELPEYERSRDEAEDNGAAHPEQPAQEFECKADADGIEWQEPVPTLPDPSPVELPKSE